MRILYQFPLSHFCEKARWMLDYKELEYVAQNLMPGAHRAFARLKTGQNRLPILRDQEQWIADSTKIALYLDEQYPEHRLLPAEASLRQQALDIDEITQELGRHVRRWMLAQALSHDHESMDILIGEKGYLRQFEKFSKPLLKTILTKGYALTEETLEQSKQFIKDSVEQLNQIRMEKEGPYLVGSRFSLADIASVLFWPLYWLFRERRGSRESFESMSDEYREYQSHLAELPLGQYIQKMYRNERNARVDWRGV
jgi:Glutathione S-transferase